MKIAPRVLVWTTVAIIAVGAIAYVSAWRVLGIVVSPIAIGRAEIVQTVVASGKVETPSRVDLGAQIIGTVAVVFVIEGARVVAGDTLVALDDTDARAALEVAQAAVTLAEAKLGQLANLTLPAARQSLALAQATRHAAQNQLDSLTQLAQREFATRAQTDDARRAFDVAEAQVRTAELNVASASPGGSDVALATAALGQARASLHAAEARVGLTSIATPTDGTVIARYAEPGMVVQAGKALVALAPTGLKRLIVQVDERNLSLIALGQPALASADAYPGQSFKAVLGFINPAVDAARGSVEVKLTVATPPAYLKEDMTVSVDIEVARRANALVVATGAVRDATGGRPHMLLIRDGRAVDTPVTIGARGEGTLEILSGAVEGDLAVPSGVASVSSGARVRIAPTARAAAR